MSEIKQLQDLISDWAESEFPDADIGVKFRKLGEEVGELGEALIGGRSKDIIHELCDCILVELHMLRMMTGMDPADLLFAVAESRIARGQ